MEASRLHCDRLSRRRVHTDRINGTSAYASSPLAASAAIFGLMPDAGKRTKPVNRISDKHRGGFLNGK